MKLENFFLLITLCIPTFSYGQESSIRLSVDYIHSVDVDFGKNNFRLIPLAECSEPIKQTGIKDILELVTTLKQNPNCQILRQSTSAYILSNDNSGNQIEESEDVIIFKNTDSYAKPYVVVAMIEQDVFARIPGWLFENSIFGETKTFNWGRKLIGFQSIDVINGNDWKLLNQSVEIYGRISH